MLAVVQSTALRGIEGVPIEVQVDVRERGLPATHLIGLPETTVRESLKRVWAALDNSGYPTPRGRTTINLAPAGLRKVGAAYDLPIAVGVLAAMGRLAGAPLREVALLGELALDGSTKPVTGVLPSAAAAARRGVRRLLVPEENAREAAMVPDLSVYGVPSLGDAVELLSGRYLMTHPVRTPVEDLLARDGRPDVDLAEVRGQDHTRRALEIAAAGNHNILLVGPPGAGKTMLIRRLPTILPSISLDEAIETTKVYSVAGLLRDVPLVTRRPFRAPHHTVSDVGLAGGGSWPRPGEISLAHNGVLFLDEMPEFRRSTLEVLRQPLEDRRVTISRANATFSYPARFLLAGAMNPCPCGYHGDTRKQCTCTGGEIHRYHRRLSGPLLDRIDLQVAVPAVAPAELAGKTKGESTAFVRKRVERARGVQTRRFGKHRVRTNAEVPARELERFCGLGKESSALLLKAMETMGLSVRAWARIHRVARTIADLAGRKTIGPPDVAEAIQYAVLDREGP